MSEMPVKATQEKFLDSSFSVCQFFEDDSYEYVRRNVSAEEAMKAFMHYCSSVGAQLGTTKRVIITDAGDCTNMEWIKGKGITFPLEFVGRGPK